jgi:hypothetical protein
MQAFNSYMELNPTFKVGPNIFEFWKNVPKKKLKSFKLEKPSFNPNSKIFFFKLTC